MRNYTDSQSVEYNEDGSWTTTTVTTEFPATRAQKAQAWAALGAITLTAFSPVIALVVADRYERYRANKREKKLENEKND